MPTNRTSYTHRTGKPRVVHHGRGALVGSFRVLNHATGYQLVIKLPYRQHEALRHVLADNTIHGVNQRSRCALELGIDVTLFHFSAGLSLESSHALRSV